MAYLEGMVCWVAKASKDDLSFFLCDDCCCDLRAMPHSYVATRL